MHALDIEDNIHSMYNPCAQNNIKRVCMTVLYEYVSIS